MIYLTFELLVVLWWRVAGHVRWTLLLSHVGSYVRDFSELGLEGHLLRGHDEGCLLIRDGHSWRRGAMIPHDFYFLSDILWINQSTTKIIIQEGDLRFCVWNPWLPSTYLFLELRVVSCMTASGYKLEGLFKLWKIVSLRSRSNSSSQNSAVDGFKIHRFIARTLFHSTPLHQQIGLISLEVKNKIKYESSTYIAIRVADESCCSSTPVFGASSTWKWATWPRGPWPSTSHLHKVVRLVIL
jgi:hypothetical protein